VIANRYDVMAKYAKSIKSAWKEELEHLKHKAQLEARFLKSSRKLLQREPASWKRRSSSSCRTVPAQQSAGNHAQYARGTGRDLGAFALHARPAAA
jgi:hypothetical protein